MENVRGKGYNTGAWPRKILEESRINQDCGKKDRTQALRNT